MSTGPGPVALVGSGEFLEVMAPVDAALLRGRPQRAVIVPTAAAREGDARVAYWIELGRAHYEAMGVEPVPLDVRRRSDAQDPGVAARVAGAGLVYLSGGDPHHLADTLRGTALLAAIGAAWRDGAALAGCSAGAMALTAGAPPDLRPAGRTGPSPEGPTPEASGPTPEVRTAGEAGDGLGLVAGLAVIPHFDQVERWRPGAVAHFAAWAPGGTTLLGIEEGTALVGSRRGWEVQGAGSVWVLGPDDRARYESGATLPLHSPHPVG